MIRPTVTGKNRTAAATTVTFSQVGARRCARISRAPQLGFCGAAGWALSFGSITLPRPYVPASLEHASGPRHEPGHWVAWAHDARTRLPDSRMSLYSAWPEPATAHTSILSVKKAAGWS